MEHLSALDAGFLEVEDSDPHISMAIGGVSVLDGPVPDFDELVTALTERLVTVPRLRRVLRTHRFDLEPPEWVERTGLDLRHHFRRTALPQPGDDATLFRAIADIFERRLDRDHPLWECWVIEGLAQDRWALVMKVHHCIADGISATRMVTGLSDNGASATTFATDINATDINATDINATKSAAATGAGRSLPLNPLDWGRGAVELSATATTVAARALRGTVEVVSGLVSPAAASSLNGPVSTLRRYHAARVSLSEVNAVCAAFDATLNDVALTAITQGYREVLLRRGERPDRTSLRTLVPVSVRQTEDLDTPDNRVSIMLPLLPVDRANPLDQLRLVRSRMSRAKSSGQKQAGSSVVGVAGLLPFPLTAWAVRLLSRLPQRGVVSLATNVPGPRQRLQVLGRDVVRMLPVPPIALHLRSGIAMLSYGDDLTFGIVADYDSAPDLDVLATGIERSVARLAELAAKR
ncbi:WS/DGAT/MGAT family O-acyltransferase [Mycolicibacterium palauense]|uniref:WS/DGAT/MGAT family O-acyltransferase n=1 Tax=Mycolicibacterium palauense TaxID=2034511 RepID=UPI000BFEE77D|nr:wax ester/triacylglycerol synthase family O-acyltransferase [Mycolicibacterium palauense]